MATQLAQFWEGSNPKIKIKHNLGSGVYENLEDILELYVYILDAAGNTIARYSKAGTAIGGNTFIALIKESVYEYKVILTSTLTKTLGTQNLQCEINPARNDSELVSGISDYPVRFTLLKMIGSNIKEITT